MLQERPQRLGLERRDGDALALADLASLTQERFEVFGREQVRLVEGDDARDVRVPEVAEDSLDRFELLRPARVRGVDEVNEKVAVVDLFERGAEGGDEVGRQVAYEADRVVDDHLLLARQTQAARGRVERGEHAPLGQNLGGGERVQERRLAGVGVADDGDDGQAPPRALLAALLAAHALVLDLLLKTVDAVAHAAAVGLKLGLAGAAPADAARQPREGRVVPGDETRQHVAQLRQLDLNLALARLRALREDVEDELRAVDDLEVCGFGDSAHLRGAQLAVEDEQVGAEPQGADDQLVELAAPEHRARVDGLAALDGLVHDDQSGRGRQLAEFRHRLFGLADRGGRDADEDGAVACGRAAADAAVARDLLFERADEFEEVHVELRGGRRLEEGVGARLLVRPGVLCDLLGGGRQEVRAAHLAGQTRAVVHVDRDHQVEAQQREVVQVVLRQLFAAQVRVDGAQAAETPLADARALEVGPLDAARVADDDRLDVALAVDERADLAPRLVRKLGELARELGRNDLLRRDAARVKLLDAPELVGLEPLRVALYVADNSSSAAPVRPLKVERTGRVNAGAFSVSASS